MNLYIFLWIALAFAVGVAIGCFIMYKYEQDTITAMLNQCTDLAQAEKELREEREECRNTRAMFASIEDIPTYIEDECDISEEELKERFEEGDEDYSAIYE